jgi:hypothetical protein
MTTKTESLIRLARSARRAAKRRGHTLARFRRMADTASAARCSVCGAEVFVDARPAPNGIDIGGEAVALNCPAS